MNDVLFERYENGLATITLNRPKAINALSYEMIVKMNQVLREWAKDEQVSLIVMKGAGEKGFCAGGDIKTLYQAQSGPQALQHGEQYFELEYDLDLFIHRFPKPIVACLDGVVMGGGVGLTSGASHRIVTERTKWAMPEMNIGFFPDVGASYFLNQAPGYIGRYLALTAAVLKGADVLYINGADVWMSQDKLHAFLAQLHNTNWHEGDVLPTLNQLIQIYQENSPAKSELAHLQQEIDVHFSFPTVEEILFSLQQRASHFTESTKKTLEEKSPVSLKVALKQMIEGKQKNIEDCFAMELVMAKHFLKHPDFFEGIRSVLIDKDQSPIYVYKQLEDVSEEVVEGFFEE